MFHILDLIGRRSLRFFFRFSFSISLFCGGEGAKERNNLDSIPLEID